ncbi:odorant receptor 131-2-like [Discoglossus pictus]
MTQTVSVSRATEIARITLDCLMFFCLVFFFYFITVILIVYFSTPHVRENARYILFVHMLINDIMYLLVGIFLLFITRSFIYLPMSFCYILITASSTSFKVTPYNLAVMALERYVAICLPLRHGELCTRQSANIAIAVIWAIGLIPNIGDFIALSSSVNKDFFSLNVICSRAASTITVVQNNIRFFTHTMTFSLVGLVIVFTYIKIMMVALKVDANKASASKAGKTVILHAVQLLLCMLAFSYTLTETFLRQYVAFLPILNFFTFMCLPRFLSPVIYGIRDEVFRNYIKKQFFCAQSKIASNA